MRLQAMPTGLLALALGVAGVSSTKTIDWDRYKNEGWTCLTPPRRTQPGRSGVSFGNTVCPKQVETCRAYCSYRGGTFSSELSNSCWSDNEGRDSPFQSITYCWMCRCADDPEAEPDLSMYYGSIQRYVCERQKESCQYAYNQYAQTPPEGKCECPPAQSISLAPGATVGKIASVAVVTGTAAAGGYDIVTLSVADKVTTTSASLITSTTAPLPTATEDGSGLWDSLEGEEVDWANGGRPRSSAAEEQVVQATSTTDQVPTSTSETVVDSGAMRQAVGMVGAVLAAMMAI